MSTKDLVLVTGGSGFVGSHCIVQLLEKGYRVRTTIRSLTKADTVRQALKRGGAAEEQVNSVEFCAAELGKDDGWAEACKDCTYVLHVASPFPATNPKNEDELIIPAREGTLRALRAAKEAGTVKRVVVTGSGAAISMGHPDRGINPFTEEDWTILDDPKHPVLAYAKSKTVAERAAWDWIEKEGGNMQLTVVKANMIFGPLLNPNFASSIEVVSRLMKGQTPGLPRLSFGAVDVRDVASMHVLVMTHPKAAGQRYLASSGDPKTMRQLATTLRERLGPKAKKVPTRNLPDFLLRFIAIFDPTVAMVVPELGLQKFYSYEKAKRALGWMPRSPEDAVVASAESMIALGLL
jgi:dihydroflavonol-4-reductase